MVVSVETGLVSSGDFFSIGSTVELCPFLAVSDGFSMTLSCPDLSISTLYLGVSLVSFLSRRGFLLLSRISSSGADC